MKFQNLVFQFCFVPEKSLRVPDESTTVLLGEGVVGRCAQHRCLQVYRQGVITDGVYTQKRMYCSMNVPVPEDSFNINGVFYSSSVRLYFLL